MKCTPRSAASISCAARRRRYPYLLKRRNRSPKLQNNILEEKEALTFCLRGEDHFFEKKSIDVKPREIEKSVVAFANAEGGDIIIGIEDDKATKLKGLEKWRGSANIEFFNEILSCIYRLNPSPTISNHIYTLIGYPGYVLKLSVEKGHQVFKTSDDSVYIRAGAQKLHVKDPEKISNLNFAKGVRSFEDINVDEYSINDLVEEKEIQTFCKTQIPYQDPLNYLINQHLIDVKTWDVKTAAALLFSSLPSTLLKTKCAVKIARYETRKEGERDDLKETFTIEGCINTQIIDAAEKIKNILSTVKIWSNGQLLNVEYPIEAIWEILVNAVIHRDYSIKDDVKVLIYDNRIEIHSPGKLPGHITPENILDERYTRNPKIVRTLSKYANSPNKDIGEGLNTAFQKMKDWKLQAPVILEKFSSVIVTLKHSPLARPEELVLTHLQSNGRITNEDARAITGIKSENTMKQVFKRLQKAGKIELKKEKGKKHYWVLKGIVEFPLKEDWTLFD